MSVPRAARCRIRRLKAVGGRVGRPARAALRGMGRSLPTARRGRDGRRRRGGARCRWLPASPRALASGGVDFTIAGHGTSRHRDHRLRPDRRGARGLAGERGRRGGRWPWRTRRRRGRRWRRRAGCGVHAEIDALLADRAVEAVLVATPTAFHFDHASRAGGRQARAGREADQRLDLDVARLVGQAEAAGLVLSVFHNHRWDVDYLTVRDAVAISAFGRVVNVESRLGQYASCVGPAAREYRPGWQRGGVRRRGLYDWGSHFVDQLWRSCTRPARCKASRRNSAATCGRRIATTSPAC